MLYVFGTILSYIGSLPAGMINLNVLYTAVERSKSQAVSVAIGAAVIEAIQAAVAALVYARLIYLTKYEDVLRYIAIAVFISLAVYYIYLSRRKLIGKKVPEQSRVRPFWTGAMLSSMNVMAYPYWLMVLRLLSDYIETAWTTKVILFFGLCAGFGGFLASMTYIVLGQRWLTEGTWVKQYLDYVLAGIFLFLALMLAFFKG